MSGIPTAWGKQNIYNTLGGQVTSDRAPRFPIHIPIRYRMLHSRDWLVGSTENVSRSGVLFRAERPFELTATLDLRLELPPINNDDRVRGEIACKGEVVRVEWTYDAGGSVAVAVAIHDYRLVQKRPLN